MKKIQFIEYTPQQLQKEISEVIKIQLDEFLKDFKPKQPSEYLTRSQVSSIFDVDISTINNWSRKGKLKPLAMGGRIYFLRKDIEESLTPLNG